MLTINKNVEQHIYSSRTHRLCTCWRITRKDGIIFRFTDHNSKIIFGVETFTPIGGFNATAREKEDSLNGQNVEFSGMISSASITAENLREGKYRGAIIEELLVDWMYPWVGAIRTTKYFVRKTKFNKEFWEAEIEGLTYLLGFSVGDIFKGGCRYELGDAGCKFDLPTLKIIGVSVDSVVDRVNFTASHTGFAGKALGYFAFGLIKWTSGVNNTLFSEVRTSTAAVGNVITFSLLLRTTFDISVSGTFEITPGCDKLLATCLSKFANVINFGGFPFISGLDKASQITNF